MSRISLAFRSFFAILFGGGLPADIAQAYGFVRPAPAPAPAPAPKPQAGPKDGAIQILSILQRDSRLVDFLMEDISGYSDDQVGAAVRELHGQAQQTLARYFSLQPVIDGVEGTFTKTGSLEASSIKFLGNVPASGKAPGGLLRHKGWKADKVDLPATPMTKVVAPAEVEVE